MAKNIIIYSDGTGQVGGKRPDQQLSNVYKLYRATRVNPLNCINPADQIAFYDAGLGSEEVDGTLVQRVTGTIRKIWSSAFGAGFTHNVADCYEALLSVYEPGDRIFLFGFSRGAYTVRSVGGVMNLCGVPTRDAEENPIPRRGKALRKIAEEAVHTVYEHGAGHPRRKYEDEREELARRFRVKYGTQDDQKTNERGNVVPYFIGVFDTVAALGVTGAKRVGLIALIITCCLAVVMGASGILSWVFGWSFWTTTLVLAGVTAVCFGIYVHSIRVRIIRDYPKEGEKNWHWSHWRFKHYDMFLDPRVRYARHAQAIDERRTTFSRVGWGKTADMEGAPEDWLVQTWFAGNHSDIGGSYPETESRLSDIVLKWMAKEAERVPKGLKIDWTKLKLFPDAAGMQHCEAESTLDRYPRWWLPRWRRGWNVGPRPSVTIDSIDPTVLERFELSAINNCGRQEPYRPEALQHEPSLASYYEVQQAAQDSQPPGGAAPTG